jgi:hypothetical protein
LAAAGGPPPAGELLTGNIGSLRELAATKSAPRSLRLADLYRIIKYYIIIRYVICHSGLMRCNRGFKQELNLVLLS